MNEKITFYSYGKDKPGLTERIKGIKEPAQIVRGQDYPRNIQSLREGKKGLFAEVIGREATIEEARLRVSELMKEGDLFYSPDKNGEVTPGILVLSKNLFEWTSYINDHVEQVLQSGRTESWEDALKIVDADFKSLMDETKERIDQIFLEHMPFAEIFMRGKKEAERRKKSA